VPKSHPNLLFAENTILVVIDMQEPFLRTIFERERVQTEVCRLIQGMSALRVPVISTTQYAERMGDLIPEVKRLLSPLLPPFDKMSFSACDSAAFVSEVTRSGRKQVALCGVESHICVSQTAHDLVAAGFQVQVVTDAVSSRTEANWRLGLDRMRQGGVLLTSVEAALYELLQVAGTPEFRQVLELVK
jgi:nicotinamidase-related amidase